MLGYAYPLDSAGHATGPNSQKVEIIYYCIKVIDLWIYMSYYIYIYTPPLPTHTHTHTHTHSHWYQLNETLVYTDNLVKIIYDGLKERGIEECVNIIIVSDHGMAPFGTKQFVQLSEVYNIM